MALSKSQLKARIVSEMQAQGATASGKHSWVNRMAEAIANAVVDEVQANADVPVTGGSSSGTYKVK
ncbi:hypothetical protein L0636_07645 [Halomonas janggokensis]|uniref:Uncharacterized protein n=1 Tax=Vreelandella subterranea TaxID=416874 RepID=A0A1H9UIT2_9GAMM|nr:MULTISPECIES: hypothetical protein [Halomonas]MCZ0930296.1 hypothetical protein [Halomonas janggokensis]SES09365.1 hypothetical protein SAMN04487958_10715 [Halomonas subterranea]